MEKQKPPVPGGVEAISMLAWFPFFIGLFTFIPYFMNPSSANENGMAVGMMFVIFIWFITVIPTTAYAIKGLRTVNLMKHPTAIKFRYITSVSAIIFNATVLLLIIFSLTISA